MNHELDVNNKAIHTGDKRIINGRGDINQLMPFKYPWAWEFFLISNKNNWSPLDINMSKDINDYHHEIDDEQKHVFENVLAYLSTADVLAMRNIGLAVMEKMSAPELQAYQSRQIAEEATHCWSYSHAIETIGLDQKEIYNRYRVVPAIHGKIAYSNKILDEVMARDFELNTTENIKKFALAYIFFAAIFEGVWFTNGFTPLFALQRLGVMKGTAEQISYISRDENLHVSFGIRVIKELLLENPEVKIEQHEIEKMFKECEALEADYADYILPGDGILGYTAEDHKQNYKFFSNRRCRLLGFAEPYPDVTTSPTPWMDEQALMSKEKNFFETTVTEYQVGAGLDWGD